MRMRTRTNSPSARCARKTRCRVNAGFPMRSGMPRLSGSAVEGFRESGSHRNSALRAQGSVLVALLWCLMLLSLIVIGLLHTTRIDLTVQKNYGDHIQAHYLAVAGIEKAKALLYRDARERSRIRRNHNGLLYDSPEDFREVTLGRGKFRVFHRAGANGRLCPYPSCPPEPAPVQRSTGWRKLMWPVQTRCQQGWCRREGRSSSWSSAIPWMLDRR